jgi:hypothetical protein
MTVPASWFQWSRLMCCQLPLCIHDQLVEAIIALESPV